MSRRRTASGTSPEFFIPWPTSSTWHLQGACSNGAKAFRYEISKAGQSSRLNRLCFRLGCPPHHSLTAPCRAAGGRKGLRAMGGLIVKANTGGSGKGGSRRFTSKAERRWPWGRRAVGSGGGGERQRLALVLEFFR